MDKAKESKLLAGITISNNVPDFSKDPNVIKRAERARANIARVGLPKDWTKKTK